MDRLQSMLYFVRVVTLKSFSRAAAELGVSAATVTTHVRQLEQALGVRLLDRNTRSLKLTEAGAIYVEHCRQVLGDIRHMETLLAPRGKALRGVLRADVPVVLGRRIIAPQLPAFLRRYPQITLELSMENRSDDLIGRDWDCAIRIGELPDSSLVARRLGTVRWITCAAPAYLERAGEPRTPEDLLRHNCLGFMPVGERTPVPWQFVRDGRTAHVAVRGNVLMDSLDPLLDAAVAGVGMVQVDASTARALLADHRLQRVLADFEADGPPITLIASGRRQMPPKVAAFGEFVAGLLTEGGGQGVL
ncbi:LysR family transcriptional regulator [Rhodanobacter glycinis]|uniref:LysR family transcriptional regulator n=1 Tax=Rhodanobacter glycinis TaxID=582702 RepID=A0A502BZC3_9GAMM|nr:LysR family transcriptional regulator [Rhodanobacter glycinis]TPG05878.1 LysR family transcriptional regulator [Rhodanobacter glycinis]TPG50439.1 LysR family transcriptional regulator [Rhodanobacter glycinis]